MTLAPDDPRHGTANGYKNLGCRCKPCCKAHTAEHMEYLHHSGRTVPMDAYLAERRSRLVHGTEAGYNRGCRCLPCKRAANEARQARRLNGQVRTHNAAGYSNGCRCEVCTAARTEKARAWRKRTPA